MGIVLLDLPPAASPTHAVDMRDRCRTRDTSGHNVGTVTHRRAATLYGTRTTWTYAAACTAGLCTVLNSRHFFARPRGTPSHDQAGHHEERKPLEAGKKKHLPVAAVDGVLEDVTTDAREQTQECNLEGHLFVCADSVDPAILC